jgi:hypothetical protein
MDTTHTNDVEMVDTSFILWCLIEGQINHFSVAATDVSIKVAELKTMIKQVAEVDHPAHKLNLWKVRCF